ncbi:hypothetical protein Bca4012_013973 [Brassica carinata]
MRELEGMMSDVGEKLEVDILNELEVSKLYHCDGLVLCVAKDKDKDKEEPKLVLWNPKLCQTRWIEPREDFNVKDRHAIGYSDDSDGRRNHKILRFVDDYTLEGKHEVGYEIYEIRSNSWRVLEVVKNNPKWSIDMNQRGVSVKGNAYFFASRFIENHGRYGGSREEIFLLCFDFTQERFGPRLPLPFSDSYDAFTGEIVTLSTFLRGGGDDDDEQLAVLTGGFESGFFEIWVTLAVHPNRASWTKFLRMEPGPFCTYGFELCCSSSGGSFFVDEENKVAVLFELSRTLNLHKAFVFVQDGGFKSSVKLGEALILEHRSPITNDLYKAALPPLFCSYRPSFVQLEQPLVQHKRKRMSPLLYTNVKLSKRMSPPPAQ